VAEFKENQAVTLDRLAEAVREKRLENYLVPLEALLPEFPELVVRGRQEVGVRHGLAFELAQSTRAGRGPNSGRSPVAALLKILNPERRLIAIARHVEGSVYHPHLVLV
jgi:tRNA U55 pseudouridine synthase TruB